MITVIRTLLSIILKIPGFFYPFLVVKHRHRARAIVYSYTLHNKITDRMKRLYERNPEPWEYGWALLRENNPVHGNELDRDGWIAYIPNVSKLQFWWWFITVWMWFDDDANGDTCDYGGYNRPDHISRLLEKKVEWWNVCERIAKKHCTPIKGIVFGNTLDLGNIRGPYAGTDNSYYQGWNMWVWNCRNTTMNLKIWFNY